MRFPKRIKLRGRVFATVYNKTPSYPMYRVAWSFNGKRQTKAFPIFGGKEGALSFAEDRARECSKGLQTAALTSAQAADALAALEKLQELYQSTGQRASLLSAVAAYCESAKNPTGVQVRKDLVEAVEEFLESRKHQTEAKDGKRARLSVSYERHVAGWLRGFANAFPNNSITDLTKDHLNRYFGSVAEHGVKNRNDRRAAIKMFFEWATREDYLGRDHRLNESNAMQRETADDAAATDFYRPSEFRKMLEAADAELLPVLAIGGLAGLRVEEIMRLEWQDVFRVPGHIEVSARQSKTRARRLVEICPALTAWLEPYRGRTGTVFAPAGASHLVHAFGRRFTDLRETLKIPMRRNGLRHAFCTYHFALHSNENLTAAQAGNSPNMVHGHYKGLATKAEAEAWFAVKPAVEPNIIPMGAVNE